MPILNLKKPIDNFPQVQTEIRYYLGGINYFNYKTEKRGYYIHFNPCKHKEIKDGIYSTETQPLHERSFKILIKETNRKNEKTLQKLKDILNKNITDIVDYYEIDNISCYHKVIQIFEEV